VLSPKYAFISACLKGEEPKTVTAEHIDKMMTAQGLQDALATIRETDIGSYLEELPIKTFDYLDECLWSYLARRIQYVESFRFLPKEIPEVSRAYAVKYDVSNIKAALQAISDGRKPSMIPIGTIHNNALLDELFDAEEVDDIIQLLIRCKLGDYVPALEQYKTDKGARSKLLVEATLDSAYYKSMLNVARGIKDGSVLAQAFGLVIDLANLQIALRAIVKGIGADAAEFAIAGGYRITGKDIQELLSLKIADVPARLQDAQYQGIADEVSATYDKTRSITAVDEIIDKHKFRMLREMLSPRVLSPLVVIWYLILKEVEIRNLRLVLKAILDGISVQEIRDYLVL
jgi:V/A-type H+-transporting ATPase subunit C